MNDFEELLEIANKHQLTLVEIGYNEYYVNTLEYGCGLFRIKVTNNIKIIEVLDYALEELENGRCDYLNKWFDFIREV